MSETIGQGTCHNRRIADGWPVDSLLVDKRETDTALTPRNRFYLEKFGYLLKHMLARPSHTGAKR